MKSSKLTYEEIKTIVDNHRAELPQYVFDRAGRCFEYVINFHTFNCANLMDVKYRIVHGYLYENTKIIAHAWLEIDKYIYDPVLDYFGPPTSGGEITYEPIYHYTPNKVNRMVGKYWHMGPWEPLPKADYVKMKGEI